MNWKLIGWWIGLLLLVMPIVAQEPTPEPTPNALYIGQGFRIPIPEGWTDQSTPAYAHFTNPAGPPMFMRWRSPPMRFRPASMPPSP